MKKLVIQIPCLNEGPTLPRTLFSIPPPSSRTVSI